MMTEKHKQKLSQEIIDNPDDEFFMSFALAEAQQAYQLHEVPVGAVVVFNGEIIGCGYNHPITGCDPTAHAEIIALREAAKKIGNYRLTDASLYVTIEPCAMCAGALVHSRIKRLIYGAAEPRTGGVNSVFQICNHSSLNHQIMVTVGVKEKECRALMQRFFKARR